MSKKRKKSKRKAERRLVVRNATATTSTSRNGSELYEWMTAGIQSAGMAVNERTVIGIGAVYACVGLIAGSVAGLPLPVYRRTGGGGRERDYGNPYEALINRQYRSDWPAAVAREHHLFSILLRGDAFVRIHRKSTRLNSDEVESLEPLNPSTVCVERVDGRLSYRYNDRDTNVLQIVDQDDMLHIPGLGFDGVHGMTPLRHWLRTSSGISLAADDYTASFFGNGAKPDFAIIAEGAPNDMVLDQLRKDWGKRYGGSPNAHKPAVLYGGLDIKPLNLTSEDAQLIDTRGFQVEEIARIFGVPPHMIGHTEKASAWGTGIEQMSIGFVRYTLTRYLHKIEQEINRKLFRGDTFGNQFCEFATAGLERGDLSGRYAAHRVALGRAGEPGWMTVNEIRRLENMPPVEGGDEINRGQTDADQPGDQTATE